MRDGWLRLTLNEERRSVDTCRYMEIDKLDGQEVEGVTGWKASIASMKQELKHQLRVKAGPREDEKDRSIK